MSQDFISQNASKAIINEDINSLFSGVQSKIVVYKRNIPSQLKSLRTSEIERKQKLLTVQRKESITRKNPRQKIEIHENTYEPDLPQIVTPQKRDPNRFIKKDFFS